MRHSYTKFFAVAFTALLFCFFVPNSVAAAVHIDIHGGPFPARLAWTGKAVNVASSRRSCPIAEEQMVAPILSDVASIVARFHGGRVWVAGADRSSLVETKSGFQISVAKTPNSSYFIFLNRNNLSKARFEKILPAIFDCVNMSFVTQTEARSLQLFPPDGEHRATPLYSPAIGFYLELE